MCVIHPKILTLQKFRSTLCLFGLKSFHGYVILVGRIKPIACLVFYLVVKMWETRKTRKTVKTLKKKTKKCSNRNTQKEENVIS